MKDFEKVDKGLEALYNSMHENQCYACSHEFVEVAENFGTEIIADALELIKEQKNLLRIMFNRCRATGSLDGAMCVFCGMKEECEKLHSI